MGKQTYKIELSIDIDESDRQRLIDTAREYYGRSGRVSRIEDDETEVLLNPEEFIETVDDALMELLHQHPGFKQAGIEPGSISCDAEQIESISNKIAESDVDLDDFNDEPDDLDEFETGVYLCRWPNGEFSVITAPSRRQAILDLDEWAGAHPSQLFPVDSFMADFRLDETGEIELAQFSEQTRDTVWEICYPELDEFLTDGDLYDSSGELTPEGLERVRKAVEHERKRLWENQPKDEPSTELGREIARRMGTSAVVADQMVKDHAKEVLKTISTKKGKPN